MKVYQVDADLAISLVKAALTPIPTDPYSPPFVIKLLQHIPENVIRKFDLFDLIEQVVLKYCQQYKHAQASLASSKTHWIQRPSH
jgi:hypothetical protein